MSEGPRVSLRASTALGVRDLIRLHLQLLAPGGVAAANTQICSILSLGHLSPDLYGVLLEEMQPCAEIAWGGGKRKGKGRADELRRVVAHVFRILAERQSVDTLTAYPALRSRLLDFVRDSAAQLRPVGLSAEAFWDGWQVAYCLASVVRSIAVPLRPLLSQPLGGPGAGGSAGSLGRDSQGRPVGGGGAEAGVPLRKALWELLLVWSEEAYVLLKNVKALVASLGPGEDAAAALRSARESNYERAVALGISAAMARYKEPPEGMKEELRSAAAAINHASRLALAALVEGPAFDSDTRWPQGPVFTWVDKLLAVANEGAQRVVVGPGDVVGPLRREVGLRALRGLLTHNPDLFDAALNKAYDDNPSIANGYFQVLVEVYALRPVRCPAHVALGLILVKLVDAAAEVREDALHMLAVLSAREWAAPGAEPPPLPVPAPAEHSGSRGTHQPPSARASRASLTVTPADGAEALGGPLEDEEAVVVVGSLQDSYTQFQYQLSCRLARDHPELSEALAEELLTRQLQCEDGAIAHPVLTSLAPWLENLVIGFPWRGNWSERLLKSMYYVTLRHGRSLPYETDLTALLEFFGACKRIVLFLARVSPAETMGYLAVELARQQQEEDGAPAVGTAGLEHTEPRTSRAHAQAHPQPPPAVLVLGGCLDSVVSGGEPVRTLYGSYESTTSASASASMLSVGGVMVGADGASTAPTRALSARSDASGGSRSEANGGLRPSEDAGPSGGGPSPALSRAQSAAGAGGRALLSRPELVLCCLAEVVLEQPVDPQHLHLLLHVATTAADHGEPVVAAHCQQLLTNLLYSLSARHIESGADGSASAPATPSNGPMASSAPGSGDAATSSLPAATRLIRYLQSLRGRPLWPRDEFSLAGPAAVAAAAAPDGHLTPGGAALASLTVAIADALSYEPDLMSDWAARALEWATTARGRHAACRSWQVLRALRPPLKADLAAAVVVALEAAFAAGSMEGVEVAVEVIATARVLVAALPPGRLVLAPQLWWSALALLHSPHVAVYRAALGLLAGCLGAGPDAGAGEGFGLRLGSAKVQAVLLAAAPGLSAGQLLAASAAAAAQGADGAEDADPWVLGAHVLHVREGGASSSYISIAVQQLLLRGLTHPLTVVPTLRLMATLADTLAQQAGSLEARAASAGSGPGLGDTQNGGGMRGGAAPSGQDSLYNTGQGGVAPGITTGSGGAGGSGVPYGDSLRKHTALKLDSYTALLGSCRGQLFVSVAGILPLLLALHGGAGTSAADDAAGLAASQHRASGGSAATVAAAAAAARSGAHLAGWAGTGGAGGPAAADLELTAALAAAVGALGRAAAALGMPDVGAHLATLSSSQVAHEPALLDAALTALLGQMAAQLLPRYARTLLAHIADLISAGSGPGPAAAPPAAPRQVRAALLMLRCLSQVEGLRLGPAAAVAVADGPLLAPVVALTAGPLGPAAVEALAAVMRHCRGSTFQRELAAAAGQGSAHGGPRTLFPPPTPVVAALKPVVETLGTGLRRRGKATRLMPFLGTAAD
ncbi:hypothetical protein HYH03_008303 [Edaphochlamys debaryana]|uniref:Cell morphogenesis central region domain-containing protein n=1 Tax=Edaphochlamys debaryana TaxID=47281 RepID=A0A835XYN7_9CHLO|nr:hypothetical protein HYH03_008303 [Edaphochlamys debaryana]|eukprot:KAG2493487.1 hypothetical protein HYH03_008303 [Edaphochlamys debaryana]